MQIMNLDSYLERYYLLCRSTFSDEITSNLTETAICVAEAMTFGPHPRGQGFIFTDAPCICFSIVYLSSVHGRVQFSSVKSCLNNL